MRKIFNAVTRSDEEGTYVVLPPGSGFEADEDVVIEQVDGALIIKRHANREAIASSNNYVEKHDLPLAQHRQF